MFLLGHVNPTCMLPKEVGRCKAAFKKFYFNFDKAKCEEFTYGGCGGNANNFNTLDECRQACVETGKILCSSGFFLWFFLLTKNVLTGFLQ